MVTVIPMVVPFSTTRKPFQYNVLSGNRGFAHEECREFPLVSNIYNSYVNTAVNLNGLWIKRQVKEFTTKRDKT